MARNKNNNFRLGLNRQQLIEAATQLYGKSEKSAKKSNTKALENFVIRQLMGTNKGKLKFPELSPAERRDVSENADAWGTRAGIKQLTYRTEKKAGLRNEQSFLRVTIADSFSLYYDGIVTRQHIDELISRLPQMENTQVDSDMIKISPYYRELYIDYADEIEEREKQEERQNNQQNKKS